MFQNHLDIIKGHIQLPTVIGFGISNEAIAKSMAEISDGIIIGSAFLKPFLSANDADYANISSKQLAFIQSIYTAI